MDASTLLLLAGAFFVASTLYSSVGHGGASAYLAIMALFALPQDAMRPTALALNILVAGFGAWRFVRAGRFEWALFWPIAIGAAPFAFIGGAIRLPSEIYRPLLGAVVLLASLRLALPDARGAEKIPTPPPPPRAQPAPASA
ncbi:MAG: sulfite exporter TauE/SafE family protein [Hyphomonadaceae bacterium]